MSYFEDWGEHEFWGHLSLLHVVLVHYRVFNRSHIEGHLGCFQVLTVTNKTTIDFLVKDFVSM